MASEVAELQSLLHRRSMDSTPLDGKLYSANQTSKTNWHNWKHSTGFDWSSGIPDATSVAFLIASSVNSTDYKKVLEVNRRTATHQKELSSYCCEAEETKDIVPTNSWQGNVYGCVPANWNVWEALAGSKQNYYDCSASMAMRTMMHWIVPKLLWCKDELDFAVTELPTIWCSDDLSTVASIADEDKSQCFNGMSFCYVFELREDGPNQWAKIPETVETSLGMGIHTNDAHLGNYDETPALSADCLHSYVLDSLTEPER